MLSQVQRRGNIAALPMFAYERIYMLEFSKKEGLPAAQRRWQPTVDRMLDGIDTDGPIYLMVDQGVVKAGQTLRRPGPHIDGHWIAGVGHDSHLSPVYAHGNPMPHHSVPPGRHQEPSRHFLPYSGKELIILASSHYGCDALVGEYDGEFGEGGDCSKMDLSKLQRQPMEAGSIYVGDVYMVHEAVPMRQDAYRTVVRLNVPGVALNS